MEELKSTNNTTHFGYQNVNTQEKTAKVDAVFSSVALKYDLMNNLMSGGLHHLWKLAAINACQIRSGNIIVDLAAGTGDLSYLIAKKLQGLGNPGKLFAIDLNLDMLKIGKAKLIDHGYINNIQYIQANAEQIPMPDNSVDRICISFGLRNITHKELALQEMYRILQPGGKLVILEFSKLNSKTLNKLYDLYSFNILPNLGKIIANDKDSYQYLVESIRMHPDQDTLLQMLYSCNFTNCEYDNLNCGICCIHTGYKI